MGKNTLTVETESLENNHHQHYIEIGKQLRTARIEQRLSIQELSEKTWVSKTIIRILEAGDPSRFPEEIFLRSLVVRLATTLGLPDIAQALPQATITNNILPSWHDPELATTFKTGLESDVPVESYITYLLIVTGLVSGFGWMSLHQMRTQAQIQSSESDNAELTSQCQIAQCLPQQDATAATPTRSDFVEWSDQ
ncbi:MAG: helix-turn-helix domain-containing protein [Spirulinaceae cyanobacterium]